MSDIGYWPALEHARDMVQRAAQYEDLFQNVRRLRPHELRPRLSEVVIEYYVVALTYIAYAEGSYDAHKIKGYGFARACRKHVEDKMFASLFLREATDE